MRMWIFATALLVATAVLLEISAKISSRDVESMKPKKEKLKETVANRRSKDRSSKFDKKGTEEFTKGKERKRRSFDEDSFKEFSRNGKRNVNTMDKDSKVNKSGSGKKRQNGEGNDLKQYQEKLGKRAGSEERVGSKTQLQKNSKSYTPYKRSEQTLDNYFDDNEDISLDTQFFDVTLCLEKCSEKGTRAKRSNSPKREEFEEDTIFRENLEVEKKIEKASPNKKSQILSKIENISEEEPFQCSKYSKEQNKRTKIKGAEVKNVANFDKIESKGPVNTSIEPAKEKHPKIDHTFQEYAVKDTGLQEQNVKKGFKKLSQDLSCKVNDELEISAMKVQKKCEQYKRSQCEESDIVRNENRNSVSNNEDIDDKDVVREGRQMVQEVDEMKEK